MNFFGKKIKKMKKISAGLCPAPPQRDPQNLCLQGKWMPLTLHLAWMMSCLSDMPSSLSSHGQSWT